MSFNNKRNSREDNSKNTRSFSDNGSKRGFNKTGSSSNFGKSSPSRDRNDDKKSFGKPSFSKDRNDDKKSFGRPSFSKDRNDDRKSFGKPSFSKDGDDNKKSYGRPSFSKDRNDDRKSFDKSSFSRDRNDDRKSFDKSSFSKDRNDDRKPSFSRDRKSFEKDNYTRNRSITSNAGPTSEYQEQREKNDFKYSANRKFRPANKPANKMVEDDGLIRLNRYISNAGICSRRKADELIAAGVVSVNGVAVTELGIKVDPAKDEIRYNDERLKREKMVYILLNKPKDYITTTDDPQERKTVMHLVAKATKERIYPVGRLDRNTTGLLLLTNDGNLAEKLSHPRNNVTKIYQVELNKNLAQGDFNKIQYGIELEDGLIKPDDLSYVQGASKNEVGIQIHSGKNRIVRRIFESLGYEVVKLDRVVYANLNKKDLPRGRWRYLEEKELIQLKHFVK